MKVLVLLMGMALSIDAMAAKTSCATYVSNFTASCAEGRVLEDGSAGTASFVGSDCNSTTVNVPKCNCEATCTAGTSAGGIHVTAQSGGSVTGATLNSGSTPKPKLKAMVKKRF